MGRLGQSETQPPKEHVAQHLNADPELKIVNERSPYMRMEC